MEHCIDCNSTKIVEQEGKYICTSCGVSNGMVIDFKQEWRYYGSEDNKSSDPSRCGIPTNDLLPKSSMGSVIGFGCNESYVQRRIRNMQYWNAIPYKESSLREAFDSITTVCQNAGISTCIVEEAKIMYSKVSELKTSRRTKKEAMKAASVYTACKLKNVPRSIREIDKIFKIGDVKITNRAVKRFNEIWNSIKEKEKEEKEKMGIHEEEESVEVKESVSDSLRYLHRYCSKLNINDNMYQLCYKLLEYVEKYKLLNIHNPSSRISTCLYYIVFKYSLDVSKNNIMKECVVSGVTITKCYNKLINHDVKINEYLRQFEQNS